MFRVDTSQNRIDELLRQRARIDRELASIQRQRDDESAKAYREMMYDYQKWRKAKRDYDFSVARL